MTQRHMLNTLNVTCNSILDYWSKELRTEAFVLCFICIHGLVMVVWNNWCRKPSFLTWFPISSITFIQVKYTKFCIFSKVLLMLFFIRMRFQPRNRSYKFLISVIFNWTELYKQVLCLKTCMHICLLYDSDKSNPSQLSEKTVISHSYFFVSVHLQFQQKALSSHDFQDHCNMHTKKILEAFPYHWPVTIAFPLFNLYLSTYIMSFSRTDISTSHSNSQYHITLTETCIRLQRPYLHTHCYFVLTRPSKPLLCLLHSLIQKTFEFDIYP